MSFRSPVNTGLAQLPKSTDPAIFPDLIDLYNSVHILSQVVTSVRDNIRSPEDPDANPAQALPFTKWVWLEAGNDILAGQLVTIGNAGTVVQGAASRPIDTVNEKLPTTAYITRLQGIALNTAAIGERVKFGLGPGVIELSGVQPNQLVFGARYTASGYTPNQLGGFYLSPSLPPNSIRTVIGVGIAQDYMYFNWPLSNADQD